VIELAPPPFELLLDDVELLGLLLEEELLEDEELLVEPLRLTVMLEFPLL
jgi:hypothetical protein